jgi:hypothetical protein
MSDLGETTSLERNSLEAHVDLCAMRYKQLDTRLGVLEEKMDAVQRDILLGQKSLKTTIIATAATVVASVLSVVVTILMKF